MKKLFFILMAVLVMTGCQKKTPSVDRQRDIGHKLILKSLLDLQNKNLKGSLGDLEASIKVNPSEPEAYLLLGQILLKVDQYQQAADFLNQTAKVFPDNGTVFYMLSVADKMIGQRLPAELAARHSAELFQAQQDKDNMLKAVVLLHDLSMPDNTQTAGASTATPQAPSKAPSFSTAASAPISSSVPAAKKEW